MKNDEPGSLAITILPQKGIGLVQNTFDVLKSPLTKKAKHLQCDTEMHTQCESENLTEMHNIDDEDDEDITQVIKDIPSVVSKLRSHGSVSQPNEPARGCQPVRQFHRRDESKILPHVRRGLKLDDVV